MGVTLKTAVRCMFYQQKNTEKGMTWRTYHVWVWASNCKPYCMNKPLQAYTSREH